MKKALLLLIWIASWIAISACDTLITPTLSTTRTVTKTNTLTATPSVTPSKTLYYMPTKTITPIPTSSTTPAYPVNEQVLLMYGDDGVNVYDKQGNLLAILKNVGGFFSASSQPCQFYTGSYDFDRNILVRKYNLFGDQLAQQIFPIEFMEGQVYIYDVKVNPEGDWAAYMLPWGEIGMDPRQAEFTDLQILPLQEGAKPVQITNQNTSGAEYDWLPNGQSLAYTASDKLGVTQIYQYFVATGDILQLTNFSIEERIGIWTIKVSPNGKFIAFDGVRSTIKGNSHEMHLGVLNISTGQTTWIDRPSIEFEGGYQSGTLWWSKDNQHLISELIGNYPERWDMVIWVDTVSGKITEMFSDAKIDEVCRLFPLDDIDRIGIIGCWYDDFWYDRRTQEFISTDWPDNHPETRISILQVSTGAGCANEP